MANNKFTQHTNFQYIKKERYWEISGILKKCYDLDQRALFGSSTQRASIYYEYIPAQYMEENIPFIIASGIVYDGGKEQDKAVSEGALVMAYESLSKTFTLNKFS